MTLISSPTGASTVPADNDVYLIAETGLVGTAASTPALDTNDHTGLKIMNFGGILNSLGVGLGFTDQSTGSIFNQASGYIAGTSGVDLEAIGADLFNLGSITGFGGGALDAGILLGGDSQNDLIDNRGNIFGEVSGIHDHSNHGSNRIVNAGTIEGKQFGISLFTIQGETTYVVNDGIIKGGTWGISASLYGQLDLHNNGTLIGGISMQSLSPGPGASDTVVNDGLIAGPVELGTGNDAYYGFGGRVTGPVLGEAGYDVLYGGRTADILDGGAGTDRLNGEGGSDTLTGGADADRFDFDTRFAAAGIDLITDFEHGIDKIELSHAVFAKTNAAGALRPGQFFVGAKAHDANDHIIYTASNGWLIYDANGKAAGGTHHFATLDAHLTLSASDFFIVA